jgi:hypothetical protein
VFKVKNKDYREDLDVLVQKLKTQEPFSFSKYADGELHILSNKPINNGEFWFKPKEDQEFRKQMIESFRFKDQNYFVGVSCPCCIGGLTVHNWLKRQSGQELTNLTWANLFVNGNHKHYLDKMVPLYSNFDVILVSNSSSTLEHLPFSISKHFQIGKNAWVDNNDLIDQMKDYITAEEIKNHLFLFCAGPFGNILTHQLFEFSKENTYIDIGSTLNHFLLGEAGKNRGYLRNESSINKMCTWSEE